MIHVHHLSPTWSGQLLWLLEELDLSYHIVSDLPDVRAQAIDRALRASDGAIVYPLHAGPVIEKDGRVFTGFAAICDHLVPRYGPHLVPERGTPSYWRYVYWLHYAERAELPQPLQQLMAQRIPGFASTALAVMPAPDADFDIDYLQRELADGEWFSGDRFSMADIMMGVPLDNAFADQSFRSTRLRMWSYLYAIHTRPAYRRARTRLAAHGG